MMRTIAAIFMTCLIMAATASVPTYAQTAVLGSEIMPKDTTRQNRFTNRLIAPKGEWQCGLSIMYADFNSADSDFMLMLQGMNARASLLKISPEAAYTVRDNHAVGVKFNYVKAGGMLDSATADLLGNLSLSVNDISASSVSMGGSVFQRTYVGIDKQGRFGIFWDYILGYARSTTQFATGGDPSYTVKEKGYIAFAPGVVYFPMNNVSVQASLCFADLSYNYVKAYQDGLVAGTRHAWKAQASLNILDVNFGLTIHF